MNDVTDLQSQLAKANTALEASPPASWPLMPLFGSVAERERWRKTFSKLVLVVLKANCLLAVLCGAGSEERDRSGHGSLCSPLPLPSFLRVPDRSIPLMDTAVATTTQAALCCCPSTRLRTELWWWPWPWPWRLWLWLWRWLSCLALPLQRCCWRWHYRFPFFFIVETESARARHTHGEMGGGGAQARVDNACCVACYTFNACARRLMSELSFGCAARCRRRRKRPKQPWRFVRHPIPRATPSPPLLPPQPLGDGRGEGTGRTAMKLANKRGERLTVRAPGPRATGCPSHHRQQVP